MLPSEPLQTAVQMPLVQVVPAAQQKGSTPAARPQRAFASPWHCAHRPVLLPWAASPKQWPRKGPGGSVRQKSAQVAALAALDRDWEDGSGTPLPQAARTKAGASATRHRCMVAPGTGSECH